jgi:hypothetical protein
MLSQEDLQKRLEEMWFEEFPMLELPEERQWNVWYRMHNASTIEFGLKRTGKKFRYLHSQGECMSLEYVIRFASKVMNTNAIPLFENAARA